MFKSISTLFVFVLSLVLLCGCAGGNTVGITDSDQGGHIELQAGQTLIVSLVSNPTTGYSWQISENDTVILVQQGEVEYQQDPKSEGLVGAGGTEIFRFKAQAVGQVNLTLIYHRPWEVDVDPLQTFAVQVVVK
jgi:inhibitor of cysteine peptidase